MNTFISKVPRHSLSRNSIFGISRSAPSPRSYSANPNTLCPPPKPKKDASTGTAFTVGAITLIGAATVGYAKYDPDFRDWLGTNVPYADSFFRTVFQEDRALSDTLSGLSDKVLGLVGSGDAKKKAPPVAEPQKDDGAYTPPRAVFPSLAKDDKEEKFSEIRVQKKDSQIVDIVKDKPATSDAPSSAGPPKGLSDLEARISSTASTAIQAYQRAESALKDYNRDIETIVEDSVERLDPSIWSSLKKKTEAKNEVLRQAEDSTKQTLRDLDTFRSMLNDPSMVASAGSKATAIRNIDRLIEDISAARAKFSREKQSADITDKYWRKVEAARCHFIDELEILFPDFDIAKKRFSLEPGDLDLFIVHAFANVLYYQKELSRVDTIGQLKLKQALESARKGDPNFSLVETAINEGIEREKRALAEDFQKKCLALRRDSEKELRLRLKCQEQAHVDHLADVLATREQELAREFNRKLDEQVSTEQAKYKMQMAGMIARMKGMRTAISERVEADKIAHQSQVLWSACQALHRAVKTTTPGVSWTEQVRPLQSEVEAIKKAAADGDELVAIVLAGIPLEAIERGVYPEGAIRERFLKVERVARRLALVPSDGASLPLYILSFLQSLLLVQSANPIPQAELADERVDFRALDTYDILQRARYWLDRGNYTQTLKYMNLLKGASRCVASEWLREARILLETQQAAETLMAHAVASGLLHL